jgi:hypothetical protein
VTPPSLTGYTLRAAAKEIGADAEAFSTYLDQDTSRVLALIRRTIQQAQEGEDRENLNSTLKKSLDDIRLYVQSLCRSETSSRDKSTPLIPSAAMKKPTVREYQECVVPGLTPKHVTVSD